MTQPKIEGVGHGVPRMLYASDGSNWYAVLVDSDGHVKIDVVAYPGSNAFGNVPFGYNDVYGETKTAGPVTGTQTLSGSVVPAGEVWVVTQVAAGHTDATARVTAIRGYIGGALISIASDRALAQYANLAKQGTWVLKEGDYMQIVVEALTASSYLQCWFSGYKMKVA